MPQLWQGRASKAVDSRVNDFNSSIRFDARMIEQDIQGSLVHSAMLGRQGIISRQDVDDIHKGLHSILDDLHSGALEIDPNAEDVHTFVEQTLTARVGDAGKRLHTGRSRNDQVALDIRLKPVTDRHIPFAVTFGNHDRQVGISNKDQFEKIYKALPGCVGEQAEGIDGGGTYNIPILSSDGKRTAFNLYLFDSGTDAKGGGYEPFDPQIIDWYKKKRDELKAKNGDYIPSLVFQHIPMFEHYNVLKRVGKREKGAIPAFRIHKGEHYKIDETKCVEGSVLLEPPSIPDINTGEFEALSEKDDVLGVYVGHDHKNSYVGKVGNIDVGFTQSAGFNVYGNGKQRGVRCFVLDENDPRNYKTYTKTYEQLCDGKLNTPIKDAIWRVVPTTVDMAKPMIAKALAALAAVVALIVIAVKFL